MNEAMERLKARRQGGGQTGGVLDAIMQPRPLSQGEIIQIPGWQLLQFSGHTFKLRPGNDPYMISLLDSIRENGILEPLLVRPHPSVAGKYEIIAGHTRHHLGDLAGLTVFPCIVQTLSDADAVIQMGESNVQRPDWLPSEKARTYKAHLEAIRQKRRGVQPSCTPPSAPASVQPGCTLPSASASVQPGCTLPSAPASVQPGCTLPPAPTSVQLSCTSGNGTKTRDLAAKRWGITGQALEMYIKLNDLSPVLLRMVDEGHIQVKAGFQLAFLSEEAQRALGLLLQPRPTIKINEAVAKELRRAEPEDFPSVLGLWGRSAKRPTWSVALPRDMLPEGAKQHLADPELQERIISVVRDYMTEQEIQMQVHLEKGETDD